MKATNKDKFNPLPYCSAAIVIMVLLQAGCTHVSDRQISEQDIAYATERQLGISLKTELSALSDEDEDVPASVSSMDLSKFGEEYVVGPEGVRLDEIGSGFLLISVDLQASTSASEAFHFEDIENDHRNALLSIRKSHSFRVLRPEKSGDPYLIRGFSKGRRCIYYQEWDEGFRDKVEAQSRLGVDTHAVGERRIKIPTLQELDPRGKGF